MTRLIVLISDELMQRIVLNTGGDHTAVAAFVRRALWEYLEAFSGTNKHLGGERASASS